MELFEALAELAESRGETRATSVRQPVSLHRAAQLATELGMDESFTAAVNRALEESASGPSRGGSSRCVRAPIPVVVNLSSCAIRRRPLAEWLAQEIAERYQIAQRHATVWIQEGLILLLDGLDEVAEEHREACVAAINEFYRKYTVRLVVCSRIADYERMCGQLQLYGKVTILPLTRAQIDDFLHRAGSAADGLRSALANDAQLWETIESLLMLSVAALAYHDAGAESDIGATSANLHERLWSTYCMCERCSAVAGIPNIPQTGPCEVSQPSPAACAPTI